MSTIFYGRKFFFNQDYRREEEAEDGGTFSLQTELRKKTGKEKITKDGNVVLTFIYHRNGFIF